MNRSISSPSLVKIYGSIVFLSLAACLYAYFKPGIVNPDYPKQKMYDALKNIGSSYLTSQSTKKLDKDSSDRKLSSLYTYKYSDGSTILATLVRVKKRDDFKIETYGLLTKNIDPIYLKNASFIDIIPPSQSGFIGDKKYLQTCIVPKSTLPDETDIRLNNLTATVERINPSSNTVLTRLLGTKKHTDYSCMVLTYMPAQNIEKVPPRSWLEIVKKVQNAIAS